MNGRASKRLRFARHCMGRGMPISRLKKEYKKLPYHRRRKQGIKIETHAEILRKIHQ